jgi:hypothetical protein
MSTVIDFGIWNFGPVHMRFHLRSELTDKKLNKWEPNVAKIRHPKNEMAKNFTHQNKTTLFWRKKTKITLHQNFPIYGIMMLFVTFISFYP